MGLGDSLALPTADGAEAAGLLAVAALAAVGPGHRGIRTPLLERLLARLEQLDPLISAPPAGFQPAQQVSAVVGLGSAYAAAAQMGGGSEPLPRAVTAFETAAGRIARNEQPIDFALTVSHAASVLELQGRKTKDAAPLIRAAQLYRAAADALGRDTHPADWALAHVRPGMVLYRLAGIDLARVTQHAAPEGRGGGVRGGAHGL